jgi:hypothetical protein
MLSKALFLALGLAAAVGVSRDASAGCYWQWEGIHSRFICTPDEPSCLAEFTSESATVVNDTNEPVNFGVRCGDGPPTNERLAPRAARRFTCSSSNSCAPANATTIHVDYNYGPSNIPVHRILRDGSSYHFRWRLNRLTLHGTP